MVRQCGGRGRAAAQWVWFIRPVLLRGEHLDRCCGDSVLLIEWATPDNGQAAGTITYDSPQGTAPGESLDVQTVPVTVTLNGGNVTFRLTGLAAFLGGSSFTGTLAGGGLEITPPPDATTGQIQSGTLAGATTAAYDSDVRALQHSIAVQNNAAEVAQQIQQQQQQIATDQQTVSNDISTLESAASGLNGDASTIQSDAQTTNSDLSSEKSDASAGQGSDCYNVQATVSYDASSTLEYDQQSTLSSDVNALQTGIGTVDSEISQLTGDVAALASAGGTESEDPQAAIGQAHAAISTAVTSANSSIATVNSDVGQGYQIADGLAYGECAGDGPGSPPSPIPLLNAPAAPAQSATAGSGANTGPWAIVSRYYADIQAGNYKRSWVLINRGKTTGQTYTQFVNGYSCTEDEGQRILLHRGRASYRNQPVRRPGDIQPFCHQYLHWKAAAIHRN